MKLHPNPETYDALKRFEWDLVNEGKGKIIDYRKRWRNQKAK